MISTPLRMEKPVRRPIVPPIKPNWASAVTFKVLSNCHLIYDYNLKFLFYYSKFLSEALRPPLAL